MPAAGHERQGVGIARALDTGQACLLSGESNGNLDRDSTAGGFVRM